MKPQYFIHHADLFQDDSPIIFVDEGAKSFLKYHNLEMNKEYLLDVGSKDDVIKCKIVDLVIVKLEIYCVCVVVCFFILYFLCL